MSTARLLDGLLPLPGDLTPERPYRPSVSLQRLPNVPDAEDYDPSAMSCPDCGSQSLAGRWIAISRETRSEPADWALAADCSDCGNTSPVNDIRDLSHTQRPSK